MRTRSAMQLLPYPLFIACTSCGMLAQQTSTPPEMGPIERTLHGAAVQKSDTAIALSQPRVICGENRLTITADNATLGSILEAVHVCIGLKIEVPDGSTGERTFVHLGPGPTKEVLESLLNSTEFNYVIQASPDSPGKVLNILLMARVKDPEDGREVTNNPLAADASMTPARRAWLASRSASRSSSATAVEGVRPIETEPIAPDATTESMSGQSDTKVASGGEMNSAADTSKRGDNSDKSAVGVTQEALASPDAVQAPISPDPAQNSPAAKELQDKISDMQQLFEQRKRLITSPDTPPS